MKELANNIADIFEGHLLDFRTTEEDMISDIVKVLDDKFKELTKAVGAKEVEFEVFKKGVEERNKEVNQLKADVASKEHIIELLGEQSIKREDRIKELFKQAGCYHNNEEMHQGDGSVYVTCKDCGIDL